MPVSHIPLHTSTRSCHDATRHRSLPTAVDVHALMHLTTFRPDQSTARIHHGREAKHTLRDHDNAKTLQQWFTSEEKGRRG